MLNVLLKLVFMQPKLIQNHARNYAGLIAAKLQHAFVFLKVLLLLYVLSAVFLILGVGCGAGALLLWAALPALNSQYSWILLVFPFFLFAISAWLYIAAVNYKIEPIFKDIQDQLKMDISALCLAENK